jgi:hypothetical protein
MEVFYSVSVFLSAFFFLSLSWINFFSLPDGLRTNDTNPQEANLTLIGEIYFP